MNMIKDYWQTWLAGETTDHEVDAYIHSSLAHLVAEYKSVYFAKCVLKPSPSTATPDGVTADAIALSTELAQTSAAPETEDPMLSGLAEQSQEQHVEQLQAVFDATVSQTEAIAADAAQAFTTATAPSDTPTDECLCRASPELEAVLRSFDQGEYARGKVPTWDDCALLEIAIIKLLDKNRLKIKLAMLESRYEAVVDPKKYACYKQSVIKAGDEDDLKERLYFLIWDLYWAYNTADKVGQLRQRAIKPILGLLPVIIGLFVGFLIIYQIVNLFMHTHAFSTFMIVLSVVFFGAFGALTSFQRRMSKLEVRGETFSNYLQLCSLGNEGPLALFAGGFFSLLLMILFGSGLASSAVYAIFSPELAKLVVPLFPQMYIVGSSEGGILSLALAISHLNFVGYASIAKLLVWSFFAGFAEALIPDAMTRLIDKAKLMEK